jgi:hypothetical protein
MTAILPLILKFLPYLVQASQSIPEIVTFISELRTIFSRTDIWTPQAKAQFDAETQVLRSDPNFQVID